ncbi:MAG: hypothetical protein EOM17_14955 [Synergistales bacterium]|nr:hypothetical protein [Synergistales bacterium]
MSDIPPTKQSYLNDTQPTAPVCTGSACTVKLGNASDQSVRKNLTRGEDATPSKMTWAEFLRDEGCSEEDLAEIQSIMDTVAAPGEYFDEYDCLAAARAMRDPIRIYFIAGLVQGWALGRDA